MNKEEYSETIFWLISALGFGIVFATQSCPFTSIVCFAWAAKHAYNLGYNYK